MPISNTRDLVPFVNILEEKIIDLIEGISDWESNKFQLMSSSKRVDGIHTRATSALIRADEAMAEIGTATFLSTANRGKRLEDTFKKLRSEMYEIAATVEGPAGSGGGGELTSGSMYDELNNAIASVDPTIEDGLKLDYRLRELQSRVQNGIDMNEKNMHMPYKHSVENPTTASLKVPYENGITFMDAEVTVLDEEGTPMLGANDKIITGTITQTGDVVLTAVPGKPYTLYFPVEMKMKDIPEDFLTLAMQQVIQKNSVITEIVLKFEDKIVDIVNDIEDMKGVHWTPDFSIMRNHIELVKEGITPKGVDVEVADGMANVTFSYADHPHLSHFIMERWDEEVKRYVPYDGIKGIVNK
jgi:hypothetical protein